MSYAVFLYYVVKHRATAGYEAVHTDVYDTLCLDAVKLC